MMKGTVTRVVLSLLLLVLAAVSYEIDLGYHAGYIGSNDEDDEVIVSIFL